MVNIMAVVNVMCDKCFNVYEEEIDLVKNELNQGSLDCEIESTGWRIVDNGSCRCDICPRCVRLGEFGLEEV